MSPSEGGGREQNDGRIGLPNVGPLLDALRDPNTAVRTGALRALVRLPLDEAAWEEVGRFVWRGLSDLLAGDLAEAEWAIPAGELIDAAVYIPYAEIRRLLYEVVSEGSERERRTAAHALAHARDTAALSQLVDGLSSTDPEERVEAAASLSYLDVTAFRQELRAICFHDADGDVRFWLSLTLGRLGDTEGIERLLHELDEGTTEIRLLMWGDPTTLSDRVADRGPYPEAFGKAMERLAADESLSDLTRQIAADLRFGLAPPLGEQAPSEQEPGGSGSTEHDLGLADSARALAHTYMAHSPFSEEHGISWDEAQTLAHLDADTARALISQLLADVTASSPAGERFASGNEIMQLPDGLWQTFEPDIPALARMYVEVGAEDAPFRSQLAWTVSRAGLQEVLDVVGPRLSQGDETERAALIGLIEEVILYSPYEHGPVFGGGGPPADVQPPRPDALRAFEAQEAAIGSRKSTDAEPPKRYANAALMDEAAGRVLERDEPLAPGQLVQLRLDIGPLSDESGVVNPESIPEHLLPRTDLWLEVMVSSTHFAVGEHRLDLDGPGIARGRFFLPRDGSPAQTPEGKRWLHFWLRAPPEGGPARARVGYYYKAHLVQSQLLTADVGPGAGGWQVETDYTLSESLAGLETLPERRQVSIVTNDDGAGHHQIVVRAADGAGAPLAEPCTYELDSDTIGGLVEDLRTTLASRAPSRIQRRKRELIQDLLSLAPLGHRLFHAVVGPHVLEVYPPLIEHTDAVIQVTRPTSAGYVFPWGLMYEITLELDALGRLDRNAARICPVVDRWDEVGPMVAQGLRQCPSVDGGVHAPNTLCPFGFWGYRHPIEQLSSTSSPVLEIPVPAGSRFEVAAAQTQYGVDLDALAAHIADLRQRLQHHFPAADVAEGKDRAQIQVLLGQDLPVVYFYCHGERPAGGSAETYLGVGQRQQITAMDFQNWVKDWLLRDRKRVWDRVRPLILINACHSVEISPDTLVSYLDAFVGAGHAAGVIGTEVKVHQGLAMEVATQFFERFFGGEPVETALHAVRLDMLAHGNLFGLAYTSYCWADLKLVST